MSTVRIIIETDNGNTIEVAQETPITDYVSGNQEVHKLLDRVVAQAKRALGPGYRIHNCGPDCETCRRARQ